MKKKRGAGSVIFGLSVALFFVCAITALATDNMYLGLFSVALLFAAVILAVIAETAERRREQKRRVRYGDGSYLRIDIVSLPDEPDKLASAYPLLGGRDGTLPDGIYTGRALADRLEAEGLLLRLNRPFTVPQLADGLSALLEKLDDSPLGGITEADITALDNTFVKNRRADGELTGNSDLNAAACLLRRAYLEPVVIVYPNMLPDGAVSGSVCALNIVIVPMERIHDLYALLRGSDEDGGEKAAEQAERGESQ